MKNESRRHHYISQFYLKGFAEHGPKNPPITVINKNEKIHFKATSKNLASIYDFNRIEIKGIKPDAFESELAKFESKAAVAVRTLHENKKFEGKNRELILELIAMFATRNPAVRNNVAGFLTNVKKSTLLTQLQNNNELKVGLISLIKKVRPEKTDSISDEDINNFIKKDILVNIDTAYHLQTESVMIESILNMLDKRKWTLLQSSLDTGPFITSDTPVAICWDNPNEVPVMHRYNPGFGLPKTIIYFSLSQHLALIGKFDGIDAVTPPNQELVAAVNSVHIIFSKNQIYTPCLNFRFLTKEEGIQEGTRLLS